MKVKELIKSLLDYNMDAEVSVVANYKKEPFEITISGGEGVEKHTTKRVNFYLINQESEKEV